MCDLSRIRKGIIGLRVGRGGEVGKTQIKSKLFVDQFKINLNRSTGLVFWNISVIKVVETTVNYFYVTC